MLVWGCGCGWVGVVYGLSWCKVIARYDQILQNFCLIWPRRAKLCQDMARYGKHLKLLPDIAKFCQVFPSYCPLWVNYTNLTMILLDMSNTWKLSGKIRQSYDQIRKRLNQDVPKVDRFGSIMQNFGQVQPNYAKLGLDRVNVCQVTVRHGQVMQNHDYIRPCNAMFWKAIVSSFMPWSNI